MNTTPCLKNLNYDSIGNGDKVVAKPLTFRPYFYLSVIGIAGFVVFQFLAMKHQLDDVCVFNFGFIWSYSAFFPLAIGAFELRKISHLLMAHPPEKLFNNLWKTIEGEILDVVILTVLWGMWAILASQEKSEVDASYTAYAITGVALNSFGAALFNICFLSLSNDDFHYASLVGFGFVISKLIRLLGVLFIAMIMATSPETVTCT